MENNLLNRKEIMTYLGKTQFDIHVKSVVTSTNTVLKELAKKGEKSGYVLVAEHQTNGKGRAGRSFYSPANTGLYMSLLLRPNISAENSLFITVSAAVAVSRAIEKISNGKTIPQIKWVNDIFVNNKKVCGILTESSVDSSGMLEFAVLGIGINILPPENDFPKELLTIAGSVFSATDDTNLKNKLAAEILKELETLPDSYISESILNEYRKHSMLVGKQVFVLSGEKKIPCTVLEIDSKARLVVRFENGEKKALLSGEVSIRL